MKIGLYAIQQTCVLAPMVGVTDSLFRRLCRRFGAGFVVSEMVSVNPALRQTHKTRLRLSHQGESAPISVQIADPELLADCAKYNVDHGVQIIDVNMGFPANFKQHLRSLVDFYGEYQGVRIARKHVVWVAKTCDGGQGFLQDFHLLQIHTAQIQALEKWFFWPLTIGFYLFF